MKLEELREYVKQNGLQKNFQHQIEFVVGLKEWKEFTAISEIPTLNNAKIEVKKGEKAFYHRCKELSNSDVAPVNFQSKGYGFKEKFYLLNSDYKLTVPKGVNIMNMSFRDSEYYIKGNIRVLHSENLKAHENYYRAIMPISNTPHEDITRFFKTSGFKVDQYLKFGGLIRIEAFDIFEYNCKNQTYLIVDSRNKLKFEDFEQLYKKIIYCYSFIIGHLFREEVYYFAYEKPEFQGITEFGYESEDRTVRSFSTIIPYRLISALKKNQQFGETRLSQLQFDKIFKEVNTHPELFRCVILMTEAGNLPLELKTSIYSVCIETMRNLIKERNKNRIKPFKKKSKSREFIKSVKSILADIPDEEFNSRESIVKKIENINQIGNTESFIETFNSQEINLSEDDIKALKMRNEFLHGRIPFDSYEDDSELRYISDKLFQLVSYLIFKYCGYSGYVLNQANLRLLLNNKKLQDEKFVIRRI